MTTIRSDYAALTRTGAAEALSRAPEPARHQEAERFADFSSFDVSDDVKISLPGDGHIVPEVGHAARQIVSHLIEA